MKCFKTVFPFFFALCLAVGVGLANAAQADEIDDMTDALNQKLIQQDWKGFGAAFTEFAGKDKRYSSSAAEKAGDTAAKLAVSLAPFEDIVSHSRVRTDKCGDRLARTVTVFFTKDSQYLMSYWFFRAEDSWSTNDFSYEGNGNSSEFADLVKSTMNFSC